MAMTRQIRFIRFVIWIVILLCAGFLVYTHYAVTAEPQVDYLTPAREGEPIVEAVLKYRRDCGLWPEYLDDLVPGYLGTKPDPHWYLEPGNGLIKRLRQYGTPAFVRFDLSGPKGKWQKIGTDGQVVVLDVPIPPVDLGAATQPRVAVLENQLKEIDRRIGRVEAAGGAGDVVEYYQAKAVVLRELGKTEKLEEMIGKAGEKVPGHYWPVLARAVWGRENKTGAGGEELASWVRENPSFIHYYYLAWFYYPVAPGEAHEALRKAVEYPLVVDKYDDQTYYYFGFQAAQMAYELEDWALVSKITDRWEQRMNSESDTEKNAEYSYLIWRAALPPHEPPPMSTTAAATSKGAATQASSQPADPVVEVKKMIAQAKKLAGKRGLWADHLEELEGAIERGDKGYRYRVSPGRVPDFAVWRSPLE